MARTKDRVVAEVKRIRRRINARLMAAHGKGGLREEMRRLERQGLQALQEARGRAKAGRRKKRA